MAWWHRVRKQAATFVGYSRYRIAMEMEYYRRYDERVALACALWRWCRHTLPEYVNPSSLPNPPGTPPCGPGDLVPLATLRRHVAVWEAKADNVLLFGHTLPTRDELRYREPYLRWLQERHAGGSDPLPVEAIQEQAARVIVPLYMHPFVHERVLLELRAARLPGWRGVDRHGEPWFWRNFVYARDREGRLHVLRPQQALRVPAEAESGAGGDDADGGGRDAAEALADAREDLQGAIEDLQSMVQQAKRTSHTWQPRLIAFARDRTQTFREALSAFVEGYSEGTAQVEKGKVDMVKDAAEFYDRMMHTLPEMLSSRRDNSTEKTGRQTSSGEAGGRGES